MVYGNLKIQYINNFQDLSLIEVLILNSLLLNIFFLGIFPNIYLNYIHFSVEKLLVKFFLY